MNTDHLRTRRDQLRVLLWRVRKELSEVEATLDRLPAAKRSRSVLPECGTESAYQRHRHYRQEADTACKAAHAAHNRMKARKGARI